MKLPPDTPVIMSTASSMGNLVAVGRDDLGAPQKLQNAIGERGGARAATRKREHNEIFLILEVLLPRLERVTGVSRPPA